MSLPRARRPDEVREEINTFFATSALTSRANVRPRDRAASEPQPAGVLPPHGVVHGIAAQERGDLSVSSLHGVRKPNRRVVLFLNR
jgi:hypothetical protein